MTQPHSNDTAHLSPREQTLGCQRRIKQYIYNEYANGVTYDPYDQELKKLEAELALSIGIEKQHTPNRCREYAKRFIERNAKSASHKKTQRGTKRTYKKSGFENPQFRKAESKFPKKDKPYKPQAVYWTKRIEDKTFKKPQFGFRASVLRNSDKHGTGLKCLSCTESLLRREGNSCRNLHCPHPQNKNNLSWHHECLHYFDWGKYAFCDYCTFTLILQEHKFESGNEFVKPPIHRMYLYYQHTNNH